MKNNTTELVFILDRSGSMSGLEGDTVGGFNAMVQKQKKETGLCYVTTFLFDGASQMLHDRVKLEKVPPMTEKDYTVGGCTALLDAVGKAIEHISGIHKYARPEDVPEHTVFIITTDGMENASHSYSRTDVKRMIERQKKDYGWEFIFLAANIDAAETAADIGVSADRAVNYRADSQGTGYVYETMCCAVSDIRNSRPLTNSWREKIDRDFQQRKE